MKQLLLPCLITALMAAPCLANASGSAAVPVPLLATQPAMMFATATDESLAAVMAHPANTVLAQVRADTSRLQDSTPAVTLALAPGINLTFDLARAETFNDGSVVWQGRAASDGERWSSPDADDDHVILVRNGNMLTGDIRHGGQAYQIRPLHSGGHVVYAQDASMLPMHDEGDMRLMAQSAVEVANEPKARADDGATADVLVLFAQRAAAQYPDQKGLARLLIAQMNMGFSNSAIDGGIRLAADTPFVVSYTESGNQGTDLDRLTNPRDGSIDFVHQMRDNYKADLVTLLIHDPNGARFSCGVAWVNASSSQAFSVTQALCTANYTFTHEIGHNYGASHERAQGQGAYAYGHGYHHPQGNWGTVMAYPCRIGRGCPPLLRWSSPLLTYQGAVTGTARTEDNRRVIDQRKETMANYR